MHGEDDLVHCFLHSVYCCILKLIHTVVMIIKKKEHNCHIAVHFSLTYSNQPEVVFSNYSYRYKQVCALNCQTTRGEAYDQTCSF